MRMFAALKRLPVLSRASPPNHPGSKRAATTTTATSATTPNAMPVTLKKIKEVLPARPEADVARHVASSTPRRAFRALAS